MKKKFILLTIIFLLFTLTGCISDKILYSALGPSNGHGYSSFIVNPAYGYEKFSWGTTYDFLDKNTEWTLSGLYGNSECCIGTYDALWGCNFKPHGNKDLYVDETIFYFDRAFSDPNNQFLYAAEDRFHKTPSMDFLHNRYGQFSEINHVTPQQIEKGIAFVYKGKNYLNVDGFHALEIHIYENGKTIVKMRDPFFKISKGEKNLLDTWVCFPHLDFQNKRINFTFLNQNKEDKYLFVGYSKGIEKSNISYVRAGICWGEKINGKYEIKGNSKVISKDFLSENWYCFFNKRNYTYTNNMEDSSREILELFNSSKKVLIRHNNVISEFTISGKTLLEKMAEYGITWAEIDAALANEEF